MIIIYYIAVDVLNVKYLRIHVYNRNVRIIILRRDRYFFLIGSIHNGNNEICSFEQSDVKIMKDDGYIIYEITKFNNIPHIILLLFVRY